MPLAVPLALAVPPAMPLPLPLAVPLPLAMPLALPLALDNPPGRRAYSAAGLASMSAPLRAHRDRQRLSAMSR